MEDRRIRRMVPYSTDIAPSTDSVESTSLVSKWLNRCSEKHSDCKKAFSETSFVPSRLIEIRGTTEGDLKARLREKGQISNETCYTTLSHCWGTTVPFRLLSSNKKALLTDVPLSALSKVFKDAILLTWRLNIRYVWIDSLCELIRPRHDHRTEEVRHHPRLRR